MGIVPKMRKFEVVGLFDAGMYDYNTVASFIYRFRDTRKALGVAELQ